MRQPAQIVLWWLVGITAILFGAVMGELALMCWFLGGLPLIWLVGWIDDRNHGRNSDLFRSMKKRGLQEEQVEFFIAALRLYDLTDEEIEFEFDERERVGQTILKEGGGTEEAFARAREISYSPTPLYVRRPPL